jgi:hypothetical protein
MSHDIHAILESLRSNNGSKHKIQVLQDNKDSELLQLLLKMTYDRVVFTYGITMRSQTLANDEIGRGDVTLKDALSQLAEDFATRNLTGNAAVEQLEMLLLSAESPATAIVLTQVINRSLRINMGRSNINKVFPGLITKPAYMRCDVYNKKTAKKFKVKNSYLQLKADGTYREFYVHPQNGVTCVSRQGESYEYPEISNLLMQASIPVPGYFIGELTIYRNDVLLPRSEGNGILKKDVLPDDCVVVFDCWDFVLEADYNLAVSRKPTFTQYAYRWYAVKAYLSPLKSFVVRPIKSTVIISMQHALLLTAQYMNAGFEGAIIKERDGLFKDGTSKQQLKLKVKIELEVRIKGFNEGTPGTKRESTFGSMIFSTDDLSIQGSVSGFTDAQLEDFNARRSEMIGQVITVECNDITQARDSQYHALSHPRFIEVRSDKDSTDTFESARSARASSMMLDSQL